MSILRIVKHGESVLKKPCEPLAFEKIEPKLPQLLRDMWATMYEAQGVGLAAPQIGLNLRLSVIDARPEGKSRKLVLINPQLVGGDGEMFEEEGCLSLPGVYAKVKRFSKVQVKALDDKGRCVEFEAEGLLAKAFQHEIDHLDGKLFIDRLPFVDRLKILAIIKDLRKNWT